MKTISAHRGLIGTAILIAGAILFVVSRTVFAPADDEVVGTLAVAQSEVLTEESDEFGMPIGLYETVDGIVKRNETFTDLLEPFAVDYTDIVLSAESARDVFDVRRIRTGRPYRVYSNRAGAVEYFVYGQDKTSYVVFRVIGDRGAEVVQRPTTVRRRTVSGTINSSLYETLLDQDVNPMLASTMSAVFAWQIDFYRIQRGDAFHVVYDEVWVGGEQIDVGRIHAAKFVHFGKDYFAFHYADDEVDDYYDGDGESVRKAFLIAPVEYSRISSGYSGRRFHPVLKRYRSHLGTDYVAPFGTPIRATGDGVVEVAGFKSANGNWVKIRHNGTYTTGYLHMSKIKSGIRPGVSVKQGDVIGFVGSTGLATGNHVCYRFWKDQTQVDHRREDLPSVGPIRAEHLTSFTEMKSRYMVELGKHPGLPYGPAYSLILRESQVPIQVESAPESTSP